MLGCWGLCLIESHKHFYEVIPGKNDKQNGPDIVMQSPKLWLDDQLNGKLPDFLMIIYIIVQRWILYC